MPQVTNADEYQISDDGYVHVPLDFVFPYQGQLFTDSYMFSNGVVGFVSPTSSFCCSAYDLSQPNPSNNFSLFVLQTDLIDNGPGTFTAVGDNTSMTYSWNNIAEYGTNNLNTFSASIYSTGQVDYHYADINLTNHNTTIGYTGDTTQGEFYTYATEPAGTHVNVSSTNTMIGGVNLCDSDPLYDASCPGYQEAYLQLQCSYDPLYDQQCQGYQDAYYAQQCYNNPLYDKGCPGYTEAYLQQQCSLNSLYSSQCEGYPEAYYAQQCSIDPLYDSGCDGYKEAHDAYMLNQLCTANPHADSRCDGHVTTSAGTTMMVSVADPVSNIIAEYSMGTVEPEPQVIKVVVSTRVEEKARASETKTENAKAMKEEAKAAAKEMASAKTLEAQQKAQQSVLAMLGYVPGFGAYSVAMDGGSYADAPFYQPEALPESKSGVRNGLAQQVLHTKMIMMQYEGQ